MASEKTEKHAEKKEELEDPQIRKPHASTRKTKCKAVAVISAILLLSAVIAVVVVLLTKPEVPSVLVQVNLEEGDTFLYRVDQRFDITGSDLQKETISSIVGFQVVNKTSDAYWFLLKVSTTIQDKDKKVKAAMDGYFGVRLQRVKPTSNKQPGNDTIEPFELQGYPQTDGEFVRYLHGLLYQLLPEVRRDLYEDIDGQTDKNVKPEISPLFPGPVRMHRQANTKQSGDVMVKNHFNQSDLVNSSLNMNLDIQYFDSAAINRSNGMVSESSVYVFEELHFGQPIKTKDGRNITEMKVTLYSHVTRIDMDSGFFVKEEIKALEMHLFVRLVIPAKESVEINKAGKAVPSSWNSSVVNDSAGGQRLSTQVPTTVSLERNHTVADDASLSRGEDVKKRRVRRRARRRPVNRRYKNALRNVLHDLTIPIEKTFTLFQKSVIGVDIKGESKVWMKVIANSRSSWALGSDVNLRVGGIEVPVYSVSFSNQEIEDEAGGKSASWSRDVPICFQIFVLRICVQFGVGGSIEIPPIEFVTEELSVNPLKLAIAVEPSAQVTGNVQAYASLLVLRGGVFVDGTIARVALPTKLSYSSIKPIRQKWCLEASSDITAFELKAGLFYQWWSFWSGWGDRKTLISFGKWAALKKNWKLFEKCF